MDQNIQKALWLGVGILFFITVVSIGLFLLNQGKGLANEAGKQLTDVSVTLSEAEYSPFDNTTVSGSDVVNAIKRYKSNSGELIICVDTKLAATYQYISGGSVTGTSLSGTLNTKTKAVIDNDIAKSEDKTDNLYINKSGKFYSELIYDDNEVVRGMTFIQQ